MQVASGSDRTELTRPISETVQEADPAKSLCIHLKHDDLRV